VAAPLVAGAELNRPAIAVRLDAGYLDATTFMEYLIQQGVPQRTAHGIVGRLVRTAKERGCRLADLPLADFQAEHKDLDQRVYEVLGVGRAVSAFVSFGSTAPEQVAQRVAQWKQKFGLGMDAMQAAPIAASEVAS
jgi:argininosuccinate lyase